MTRLLYNKQPCHKYFVTESRNTWTERSPKGVAKLDANVFGDAGRWRKIQFNMRNWIELEHCRNTLGDDEITGTPAALKPLYMLMSSRP